MTRKLDQADLKDIEDIRETLADSHRVEIFADDAKLLLDAYDCAKAERDEVITVLQQLHTAFVELCKGIPYAPMDIGLINDAGVATQQLLAKMGKLK